MNNCLIWTVVIALFFGGCSSSPKVNFNTEVRRITILTEPEGATITQMNPWDQPSTPLGLSPVNERSVMIVSEITKMKNVSFSNAKGMMEQVGNVVVTIEKDGYQPYFGTLKTDPKETVVHTIVLKPEESGK